MSKEKEDSVFFTIEIEKTSIEGYNETNYDIGKELVYVLDRAFSSRVLGTSCTSYNPLATKDWPCWTCGGDPKSHPSGMTCVCEDGTHDSEVKNLRKLAAESLRRFNQETMENVRARLGVQKEDSMDDKQSKKEGGNQGFNEDPEQWSPQWLRGYLIDILKLPATADNWSILEAVRMQGIHWRRAIHEIQDLIRLENGNGPTTVEAVRARLHASPDLKQTIQHLETENARLRGVIEGMEKG